jgi:hypothetical protein
MMLRFGDDPAAALTHDQVLEQCAMLIALARLAQRFGLSAVGIQYQQGAARSCAASSRSNGLRANARRSSFPRTPARTC